MAEVVKHVYAQFLVPGTDDPDVGTATFYPVVPLLFSDNSTALGSSKIVVPFDNEGKLNGDTGVPLTCNNSPGLVKANTYWLLEVQAQLPNPSVPAQKYWFELLSTMTDPVDLAPLLRDTLVLVPQYNYATQGDLTAHVVKTIVSDHVHGGLEAPNVSGRVPTSGGTGPNDWTWAAPSSGTVTSVTGTAPITSSGGTTPAIGISAATTSTPGAVTLATPSSDTTAGHVVQASDTRLSNARPPSGAAGGALTGTYPNPTLATTPLYPANNLSDVANAGTARTNLGLGTAATKDVPSSGNASSGQAVLGSDTRLTDGRAPTGAAGGALAGTYPNPTLATAPLYPANNLSDVASALAARTNLGAGIADLWAHYNADAPLDPAIPFVHVGFMASPGHSSLTLTLPALAAIPYGGFFSIWNVQDPVDLALSPGETILDNNPYTMASGEWLLIFPDPDNAQWMVVMPRLINSNAIAQPWANPGDMLMLNSDDFAAALPIGVAGQVLGVDTGGVNPVPGWKDVGADGGDVDGSITDLTVIGLQGQGVSANVPTNGQLLGFITTGPSGVWEAVTLGGDLSVTTAPSALTLTVQGIQAIPVDATPPTIGQLLIATDDGRGGVFWLPTTLASAFRQTQYNEVGMVSSGHILLSQTPIVNSERIYRNSARQTPGTDYTISGNDITILWTPTGGDTILMDYDY